MYADRVRRRNQRAGNNVVGVEQAASHRLPNPINIYRGSRREAEHKGEERSQQGREHEQPEHAEIQAASAGQGGDRETE